MSKKSVNFKRTDELDQLVRNMVKDFYADRGRSIDKAELRRIKNRLLVVIENGAKRIKLDSVAART